MKTPTALILAAALVFAAVAFGVLFYHATDPQRGWQEPQEPEPITEVHDPMLPGQREEIYTQHPITGKWLTEEEYEMEKATIEAILCNLGESEYCDR